MFTFKIAFLVATVACVQAEFDMLPCAQKALISGVPGIVPPHDPLVIPNITVATTVLGVDFTLEVLNLTWTEIPWWEVKEITNLTSETDAIEAYKYDLYWDNFTISGIVDYQAGLLNFSGNVTITMKHVDWVGDFNMTRATSDDTAYLNELNIGFTAKELHVNLNSGNVIEDEAATVAFKELMTFLNSVNGFGQAFGYKINKDWLSDADKLAKLQAWCEAN